jgi:TRAP-type C4-dicarboxylate transport system permease large subunit
MVLIFTVLGCLLDSIAMIVLTVPLLFGPIKAYGIDPVWFGVILVLLLELGQITPPIGMNLFVVQGISKWPLGEIVMGTAPYWGLILGFIALLVAFPEIALWLPERMFERR